MKLSRRQVLAGLGTIGVASAGAGLGTTAFYSDREALEGWLEAGRVDLRLDYRTVYKPWDRFELTRATGREDKVLENGAFLVPESDQCYVVGQAPDWRQDTEGYPVLVGEEWARVTREFDACALTYEQAQDLRGMEPQGLKIPEELSGPTFLPGYVDGPTGMFQHIDDIKPLDEWETTFSVHLCGNPSKIRMRTELTAPKNDNGSTAEVNGPYGNTENGRFEPERSAGDTTDDVGELGDYIYCELWYDPNCNNVKDEVQQVCIELAIDNSDSMAETFDNNMENKDDGIREGALALIEELAEFDDSDDTDLAPFEMSVTLFGSAPDDMGVATPIIDVRSVSRTTDRATLENVFVEDGDESFDTSLGDTEGTVALGVQSAAADLEDCEGAKFLVLITNGIENLDGAEEAIEDAVMDGITVKAILLDPEVLAVADIGGAGAEVFESASTQDTLDAFTDPMSDPVGIIPQVITAVDSDGASVAETCIYKGPLSGLVEGVANDGGVYLSDDNMLCDPGIATCWEGDAVHCFALRCELPCKHEEFEALDTCMTNEDGSTMNMYEFLKQKYDIVDVNATQTDAYHYKIEFEAEQCRHQMVPETVAGEGFGSLQFSNAGEVGYFARIRNGDVNTWEQGSADNAPNDGADVQDEQPWNDSDASGSFRLYHDGAGNFQWRVKRDGAIEETVQNVAVAPNSLGDQLTLDVRNGAGGDTTVSNVRYNNMALAVDTQTSDSSDVNHILFNGVHLSSEFVISGDFEWTVTGAGADELPSITFEAEAAP
ncbi:hypothetical protein [Haloarchaeobius sp. HME9146]|uniref:hypothetical protein n=1 Tax=Haloarchaeobius sp. HME9146 TaxID=2978732 RepID=UPI0021C1C3AE|nr:hypothetical protein [Haloarchaeobius sp. HME9146]MCT9096539.1 hypothetical protein [Haloarchaeobius sp. HME9146]